MDNDKIPPRPWCAGNSSIRDARGRHVAGVTSFRWTVDEAIAIAAHIAEAVNAYDDIEAAADRAQILLSAAELRAEAAEARADDLAARLRIVEDEVAMLRGVGRG